MEYAVNHIQRQARGAILLKISIIIPVYKTEPYLRQCVDSVLSQTYEDIEVILVDDGSPDGCPKLCDQYAKADDRVKVIHQENGGLSATRNAGVQCASGDYVAFLDSDDFWNGTTALERLADRLQITGPDILNYSYTKCDESGAEIAKQFSGIQSMPPEFTDIHEQLAYLAEHSLYIASACNKLIKKNLVLTAPFENGKTSEDIEWCAKLMNNASSFDFVYENFYFYRQRSGSITHSYSEQNCMDLQDNILKCIAITNDASEERKEFLSIYTAYQFATFFAVQALATNCPKECIEKLKPHWKVLRHYGSEKKVKYLYWGCRIIGFINMCRLTKLTHKLWA